MLTITFDKYISDFEIGSTIVIQGKIKSLSANGLELDLIRRNFIGLRDCPALSTIIWIGEDAEFIIGQINALPEWNH